MALVARSNSPKSAESFKTVDLESFDITANLVTLRIESTIPDSKKCYLKLRARSHMLQSVICAQVSFFVSALNEARKIHSDLQTDSRALGRRKLLEQERKDQLKVGIIGCGHLGQKLIQILVSYGGLKAQDILVSTRRPETLTEVKNRGVNVISNNVQVVNSCHLVFLTVLPSQLQAVSEDIKGQIPTDCIIYNLVSAVPLSRLRQILKFNQIISPEYFWPEETEENEWDYCQEMEDVFHKLDMVEMTCPMSKTSKNAVVQTNVKWVEFVMYGLLNHCANLGLKTLHVIQILNRVILGVTDTNPGLLLVDADDFTKQPLESDDLMPTFDLTIVGRSETPLARKVETEKVQEAFTQNYLNIFQQYNLKLKFDPLHRN